MSSNNGAPPPKASPVPAGKAAAAAAAGKAAAGASGNVWWSGLVQRAESAKAHMAKTVKGLQKGVPVDVKVDFLRPTMDAMKESMNSAWRQLPPPVQQAVPYVGVALGSGLIVFAIQQHRVNVQRRKREEVRLEVQSLLKERAALLRQINDLHTRPRTDVEVRLAGAVAEATNAAAAAAEAAAHMVTACIAPGRPQSAPPPMPPPPYPAGPVPPMSS